MSRLAVPGGWLVAAVFAVHPVHVESVAWIIERKDLLSGLFYLTAFLTWTRFAETPTVNRYLLTLALFVAGIAVQVRGGDATGSTSRLALVATGKHQGCRCHAARAVFPRGPGNKADVDTIFARVRRRSNRPLLAGLDPQAQRAKIESLLRERAPYYDQAHIELYTTQAQTPEETAGQLLDLLENYAKN